MGQIDTNSHSRCRPKPGRGIALLGFAILCVSFFLPCPAVYLPSCLHDYDTVSGPMTTLYVNPMAPRTGNLSGMSPAALVLAEGHWLRYFSGRGAPFLVGLVGLCLLGIDRFRRPRGAGQDLTAAMRAVWNVSLIFLTAIIFLGLIRVGDTVIELAYIDAAWRVPPRPITELASPWPMFAVLFIVIFAMGFGFAAMLLTRKELRAPLGMLVCGLVSLLILSMQVSLIAEIEDLGPAVSLLGGLLVVIGAVAEVVTVAKQRRQADDTVHAAG